MSVLVVDDQPINRVVIGALLRSLHLDVIEATNGREGLLAYLRHGRDRIAFVFLDLVMPVWDGFRAVLSIRSAESQRGWASVPIVAYTSEDVRQGSPMFHKCMQFGFNDVVPKPVSRQHATQLLCRWLPSLSERQASGSLSSGVSSDDEAPCSCSQASCGRCFATAAAAAAAAAAGPSAGLHAAPSSGGSASGSGSESPLKEADAGSSSDGGGHRSSASSARWWPPR